MARKPQREEIESKTFTAEDFKDAIRKIARRIGELQTFDTNSITERFDAQVEALERKINDTLADIYGRNSAEYREYSISSLDTLPMFIGGSDHSLYEIRDSYTKSIKDTITKLTALKEMFEEKLSDISEQGVKDSIRLARTTPGNRKVFIVHGHDELLKETVARYLSRFGLVPIILHEQPNQGRTIIEKLEANIQVDYAVVLLTPDDVGYLANDPSRQKNRARQNVVLELGLFLGAIGRSRVCALYKGDLELPSDFQGVVYVHVDEGGSWKLSLAREIKQSGMEIDLNKAL